MLCTNGATNVELVRVLEMLECILQRATGGRGAVKPRESAPLNNELLGQWTTANKTAKEQKKMSGAGRRLSLGVMAPKLV